MKRLAVGAVIAMVALVGCSSGASTTQDSTGDQGASNPEAPLELNAAPVATTEVGAVKSYRFDPEVIEVQTGDEVTWSNEDDFPHNVRFLTGRDGTHDLPIGESVSVSFDEAGEFFYECSLHPQQMRGKVIVKG